jgi:hypothetical protein
MQLPFNVYRRMEAHQGKQTRACDFQKLIKDLKGSKNLHTKELIDIQLELA